MPRAWRRTVQGLLVALVMSGGCGRPLPLAERKSDASGDVASAVDVATSDNVPDARPDFRLEVACACSNCGNGVLDQGEQCDDGNKNAGDGCSAICQIPAGWTCPAPGMPCERLPEDGGSDVSP
jgi:cysteine-rich repeat protein